MQGPKLSDILFLDIETVPQHGKFDSLPDGWQQLWNKKAANLIKNEETPAEIYNRAGIYAEFGKIICISVGYFSGDEFRIKSFASDDEVTLLAAFCNVLNKYFNRKENRLCAHNGKEFDYPYIARRLLINNMPIPDMLNTMGKKPWETNLIDTMELWKFGDYKSYTSLNLLAAVFGIPTPKDDIDGSQVWSVYWQENNLNRIVNYCQKDVLTLAQIYLRMNNLPQIDKDNVVIV